MILELFISSGSETTYGTINFAFLFMAENPEIQVRCLWEIADDFGDIILSFQLIADIETTILSEIQGMVVSFLYQWCTEKARTRRCWEMIYERKMSLSH